MDPELDGTWRKDHWDAQHAPYIIINHTLRMCFDNTNASQVVVGDPAVYPANVLHEVDHFSGIQFAAA